MTLIPWTNVQFGGAPNAATKAQQWADAQWSKASETLRRSAAARQLLEELDRQRANIGIIITRTASSEYRASSQSVSTAGVNKQFGGGAVYWGILDKTKLCRGRENLMAKAVTTPIYREQDPIISLAHEMYHVWQTLHYPGARSICNKIMKVNHKIRRSPGSDAWLDWQLAIEQSCVNFERLVAHQLGQPIRDDYWHYSCPKGDRCRMRTHFINAGITPSKMTKILEKFGDGSAITFFCDTKTQREFLSTQQLLEARYRPWKGQPFDDAPRKLG
jgi:hypothetical protein